MKYPPITYSLLKEKRACKEQLDLFDLHIGQNKPIPLTKTTIQQFGSIFDIDWAANNLLDSDDLTKFENAIYAAYDKYSTAKTTALAEFNKAKATAADEYNKIVATTRSKYFAMDIAEIHTEKYSTAFTVIWDDFRKSIDTAEFEYKKAMATEFVKIYKQGLTSK
jgi:hypothetical protein